MQTARLLKILLLAASTPALCLSTSAAAFGQDGFILNSQLRSENVDEEGFAEVGLAITLRTRFGFESEVTNDFSFVIEGENIVHLSDDFNDTQNGLTAFPTIADPETTELNRLLVRFSGIPNTTLTAGRQTLNIGGGRFIGSDGGRQNQQTYDAFTAVNSGLENVTLQYSYIDRVHTVVGSDNVGGQLDVEVHVGQAAFATEAGTFTATAMFEEFLDVPSNSNRTFVANWTGAFGGHDGPTFNYLVEYANMVEYGNNPGSFDLNMVSAEFGVSEGAFSGLVGVETRGGDGSLGFFTPLASGFKFMGWGDPFAGSGTPVDGIRGVYAQGTMQVDNPPFGESMSATVLWHGFESDDGGVDLGSEIDAILVTQWNDQVSFQVKAAYYDGTPVSPATASKIWFAISYVR